MRKRSTCISVPHIWESENQLWRNFWFSSSFINFLIISLFRFMCVCILGRFTFEILRQALLLWFIVCFFTLKYCYLLLSLFITITIIFTIIFIITVTIIKYIVITLQFFTTLIDLKFDFHFVIFFFETLCYHFLSIFQTSFCAIFFPIAFRLSQLTATTGGEFK